MSALRPFLERSPGDRVRSADWNAIQMLAEEELGAHRHGGRGLDGRAVAPDAELSCASLEAGELRLAGQALAVREAEAAREAFGLPAALAAGVSVAGAVVGGPLQVSGGLRVGGDLTLSGQLRYPLSAEAAGPGRRLQRRLSAPIQYGGGIYRDEAGLSRSSDEQAEIPELRMAFSCARRGLMRLRWSVVAQGAHIQIAPFFLSGEALVPLAWWGGEAGAGDPFTWSPDAIIASTYGRYGGDLRFIPWQEIPGFYHSNAGGGGSAQHLTILLEPGRYDLRFHVHAMQALLEAVDVELTLFDVSEVP